MSLSISARTFLGLSAWSFSLAASIVRPSDGTSLPIETEKRCGRSGARSPRFGPPISFAKQLRGEGESLGLSPLGGAHCLHLALVR